MKLLPRLLALVALLLPGCSRSAELPRTAAHDYDPPVPGSYQLPVIRSAADGDVLDHTGARLRMRDLTQGRVTVMSFIYTRCADATACPYATGVLLHLHQLSAEDEALARQMRLVSVSFDPGTDTPSRMASYAKMAGDGKTAAEWRFVTTESQDKLNPILAAYGQAVDPRKDASNSAGPLNHILRVYLIDREGQIRNIYSSGTLDVRLVMADVRTLLLEGKMAMKVKP